MTLPTVIRSPGTVRSSICPTRTAATAETIRPAENIVVVTQTLIELLGMVIYVRFIPQLCSDEHPQLNSEDPV